MIDLKKIAPVKIRGRDFTEQDIQIIIKCVNVFYDKGRTYISKRICEQLEWRQPNGWLKDRACRDVLLYLDKIRLISLPPSMNNNRKVHDNSGKKETENYQVQRIISTDIVGPIPGEIKLLFAKGNKLESLWNNIVGKYHYLGHNVTVGRSIKYLIKADEQYLGAIVFSSPAWRLGPRDKILKSIGIDNPLSYTINNSRFLILPNVKIKNLASHILAISTKQVVSDWENYYSIRPLIVETFVQPSKFNGTCYKAANWLEIGMTKGYSKKGRAYSNSQEKKKIFLYGLNKEIRKRLLFVIQEGYDEYNNGSSECEKFYN